MRYVDRRVIKGESIMTIGEIAEKMDGILKKAPIAPGDK